MLCGSCTKVMGPPWAHTKDASVCTEWEERGDCSAVLATGVEWGRGSVQVGRIYHFHLTVPGTEKLGSLLRP